MWLNITLCFNLWGVKWHLSKYSFRLRINHIGAWPTKLLPELLSLKVEPPLSLVDRLSISIALRFTSRISPPTGVAYNCKQLLAVVWSSCYFHFFEFLNPPASQPALFDVVGIVVSHSVRRLMFLTYWTHGSLLKTNVFVGQQIYYSRQNFLPIPSLVWCDPTAHPHCRLSESLSRLFVSFATWSEDCVRPMLYSKYALRRWPLNVS